MMSYGPRMKAKRNQLLGYLPNLTKYIFNKARPQFCKMLEYSKILTCTWPQCYLHPPPPSTSLVDKPTYGHLYLAMLYF